MQNSEIRSAFAELSTALVLDACLRLKMPMTFAAAGIRPLTAGIRIAGRIAPARHSGSVDVFLEAIELAAPGDILVIDNEGRTDEGCIGDLIAMEAQFSKLAGLVVWGCHRDTREIIELGIPAFSYGCCPAGPRRLDERHEHALTSAQFGEHEVQKADVVFGDDDGVAFVSGEAVGQVLETAAKLQQTERNQAKAVRTGASLRAQLQFDHFLARRSDDSSYTFRQHLREIGGAVEE